MTTRRLFIQVSGDASWIGRFGISTFRGLSTLVSNCA